jgi:hypothetical protein
MKALRVCATAIDRRDPALRYSDSRQGGSIRRAFKTIGLIAFAMLAASPALALPAPMSDDELLAKSDLVALVRVLSVTCTGVAKDERTGEALPSYRANAEVMEVIKGDVAKGGRRHDHLPRHPEGHTRAADCLLLARRDGVYASRLRWRRLHHHLVERPRQARQQGHHHRVADQGRRHGRGPARTSHPGN